jgi:ATP-binding cassette subfamily B protein
MQVGQIIAFVNYLMITLFSLMMVSQLVIMLARAEASTRRIQEVLASEPKVLDKAGAQKVLFPAGRLAFENVTFSYEGDGCDPVLRGVSFTAEPGETVALLGTTGAGKSSLVHLIPRFYDVSSGRVTVNGVDVRELDQESLRRIIGIAQQEVVLFSGTIRDNIRYGRPEATAEEVEAAARAAQAHEFILSFPEGYDTQLGQRGVNLSGGQKQRIAIARALLLKPAILILDDSTSSVDVETESRIQDALEEIMHSRKEDFSSPSTSIVIAQRISTVLKADKILVLDDGQIAAQGTHLALMKTSPIYREIYESQLGNGVA